jgi:hypothetical protein
MQGFQDNDICCWLISASNPKLLLDFKSQTKNELRECKVDENGTYIAAEESNDAAVLEKILRLEFRKSTRMRCCCNSVHAVPHETFIAGVLRSCLSVVAERLCQWNLSQSCCEVGARKSNSRQRMWKTRCEPHTSLLSDCAHTKSPTFENE